MATRSSDHVLSEFQVLADGCPSRPVLDHVTGRWGTLIMLSLHDGPRRFSEVRRAVGGINDKALSQGLRQLERDGLVTRHASDGFPSRVEYRLTEVGAGMEARLREMVRYLYEQMPTVLQAQAGYDAEHAAAS
ncbi:winged helix-turn-helix transcriptional regulator [Glycomyces albidus]|jgi:DNA-binding HxlR family transcriptional regulator|uniref:Transcriptional regulator n=1 Tax=Glycomyces albidus TaxID=2656774 RepID=A0A6L5G8G5_9ACTN|nr:helix-turn-helix domain-containing protein [Glycomyces albidus]MQM25979.1 transcriptional regulator [Glycomyces albidus]